MVNTFPFCEESKLRDKVIWRCTSKKTNCKARIHMLGQSVVAVKGMHNHPPRALCLPARKQGSRKQNDATPASLPHPSVPTHPTTKIEALSVTLEFP
ncbi:putative FLYWCH-type zinc finger-containing protein 1 [Operophtera brumata]|uniref:Putative FLYWCH-type zinc finger-containing protein 1 n=1 Tax=Operophtera brumata TaxID=104452 RepID=A0A0L7L375_OPEBR|nr:putative FLYWCH-type zinc finger-containing protein 1 [Operophtera brumata]